MNKILTFFFTIFNRNLGITIRVGTKYMQREKRENIRANRVVTHGQAGLM